MAPWPDGQRTNFSSLQVAATPEAEPRSAAGEANPRNGESMRKPKGFRRESNIIQIIQPWAIYDIDHSMRLSGNLLRSS